MNNYAQGKIYKIISKNTDKFYIGSTIRSLKKRLCKHKNDRDCSSRVVIAYGDFSIILIENYPCNSERELWLRETYYFDLYKKLSPNLIVNKNSPYTNLTRKDYDKKYYDNNRPKILANKKAKYIKKEKKIPLTQEEKNTIRRAREAWVSSWVNPKPRGNYYRDNNLYYTLQTWC